MEAAEKMRMRAAIFEDFVNELGYLLFQFNLKAPV